MSGPMGLAYPTQGDTEDIWGTVLNTLLGLVENHDHSSGKGVQIPSSALAIDADVSWATHAITSMLAIEFSEVATSSVTSYVDALFVNAADHNLYFRNQGGTNVQVTSGNTLNVSIVGGIGGDYSTVGALFSYDDSTRRYLAQQEGSPRPWAGLATGDIDLYQKAASIANKVTIKSPSALAASYAVTMPAALPSAQALLQMDASGNLSASNTLASNQNLALTGSGYLQRAKTFVTPTPLWKGGAVVTAGTLSDANPSAGVTFNANTSALFPLGPLSAEWRLHQVNVIVAALTGTVNAALITVDNVTGGYDTIAGTSMTLSVGSNNLIPSSLSTIGQPLYLTIGAVSSSSATLTAAYPLWDIP